MNLDLKDFVERNKDKALFELQEIIGKELSNLKRLKLTDNNKYNVEEYSTALHEFTTFLHSGIPTTNISMFTIFIPIIENLVRLKNIPPSRLSILK